jgi:3-oxoacyl-[acyl-carrier-protein] synthase II
VSLGAGLINADIDELGVVASHSLDEENRFNMKKFADTGIRELMPLWLLKQLPNMLSSHVSILHNLQGPGNSLTTGCASAMLSIGESIKFIRKGAADAVLAGGADSKINPMSILRFYLQELLAHGWSDPREAMRPFDRKRNGFVAGEGAGTIVIEDLSKARSRGAKIYAEVIGFGTGFSNSYSDSIIGKIHAMRSAIKNAGIRESDIDLISSHGISLQKADREEREAIQRLFGERADKIPVMALKSRTGYPGAASGMVELIASVMAMKYGITPYNLNFFEPDEGDVLDHIAGAPRKKDINCVMVNVFGLGGQNAVLILRRI